MRAGIAFGSNLGDRLLHLRDACSAVLALPDIHSPVLASPVYETEPVGTEPDAEAFLNAVLEVEFTGSPSALLHALGTVEAQLGRASERLRNAPRTIDLDLLYAGEIVISNERITVPHPRLHLRRFVLQPLADIRPDLIVPGQHEPVSALLAALQDDARVERFATNWEP